MGWRPWFRKYVNGKLFRQLLHTRKECELNSTTVKVIVMKSGSMEIEDGICKVLVDAQKGFTFVVCGFLQVWVAPVKAVMPQTGYPIDMDGLWQTHAKGVSVDNLEHPSTSPEIVLDVFMKRVNSTQVAKGQIM